jgi:hypothetical protein
MKRLLMLTVAIILASAGATLSQTQHGSAVPLEPISAIVGAFKTYQIVGFGEPHPNPEQIAAFRLALIRDPRFGASINDIVVEAGNAEDQDVIDRFMRGEEAADAFLRQMARKAAFWDASYEDFFRAVRAVNANVPEGRRLRVWLGESPDHRNRVTYVVDLIRREVLAKNRRGLIIYGNTFFMRKDPVAPDESDGAWESITRDVERTGDARAFAIWVNGCTDLAKIQRDVRSWPKPSLAALAGTLLGVADFARYSSFGGWRLKDGQPVLVDGRPVVIPPRAGLHMADQYDALLYLGRPSEMKFSEHRTRCSE